MQADLPPRDAELPEVLRAFTVFVSPACDLGPGAGTAESADTLDQLVTLDQMAAMVGRTKRSLEHYRGDLPAPAVHGRRGQPREWRWSEVRGWLERTFGRRMPTRYPTWREPS